MSASQGYPGGSGGHLSLPTPDDEGSDLSGDASNFDGDEALAEGSRSLIEDGRGFREGERSDGVTEGEEPSATDRDFSDAEDEEEEEELQEEELQEEEFQEEEFQEEELQEDGESEEQEGEPESPSNDAAMGAQGSESEVDEDDQVDQLLHWWCQKELHRCLSQLTRRPQAGLFLEPLPWEELELDDWLEVVKEPMDLQTIKKRLDEGGYEDEYGFINPDFFWEDVARCWQGFFDYYEDDDEVEAFALADEMRIYAEFIQDRFWAELEAFEQTALKVDPTLSSLAAGANVALHAMEDAATTAYEEGGVLVEELTHVIGRLLGGWLGGPAPPQKPEPVPEEPAPKRLESLDLDTRQDLKELFEEIFQAFYPNMELDLIFKDMDDIQKGFLHALCKVHSVTRETLEKEEDEYWEALADAFDGAAEKVPTERVRPTDALTVPGPSRGFRRGSSSTLGLSSPTGGPLRRWGSMSRMRAADSMQSMRSMRSSRTRPSGLSIAEDRVTMDDDPNAEVAEAPTKEQMKKMLPKGRKRIGSSPTATSAASAASAAMEGDADPQWH